ncbi:MAG TPA: SDR family oxidoreductase [Nocardioides sp.]|nr:SDR family oxidoreductase [Nocardioides sp.]
MSSPVMVVVGAGPGLGAAVARRYAREGYDVVLLSRDAEELERIGRELGSSGVEARWVALDVTDDAALRRAVTEAGERSGRVDVLHFNPSAFRHKDPLALSPDELLEDVRLGVGALLVAVQAALPFMTTGGRVTATGSMAADQPWNEAASLGVQKAGLRNLVRSIDTTLRPRGIRAVSVTVNGALAPDTAFAPDKVADALFAAAHQDPGNWADEIPFDGA